MALSRKYYQKLARALGANKSKSATIESMIAFMKEDNPRFDESRFRNAIGETSMEMHLPYSKERNEQLIKKHRKVKIGGFRFDI